MSRPIDLPRVRAALRRLDALASEHPEAFRQTAEQWISTLQEHDKMNTNNKRGRAVERSEPTTQVAIRLPDSMLAALDAYAEAHTEPGRGYTRSDACRMLLAAALASTKGKSRKA